MTENTAKNLLRVRLLWQIFITFAKIAPLAFGGGYVMIPVLEREIIFNKKWITAEEIADIFAVANSIPGAIAINSATFIGYHVAGLSGAVTAMLGMVIPSFMIILLLAIMFATYQNNIYLAAAFNGIRPAIVGLIFAAAIKIGRASVIDKTCWGITLLTVSVLLVFTHLHPVIMILSGIVLGIAITNIKNYLALHN